MGGRQTRGTRDKLINSLFLPNGMKEIFKKIHKTFSKNDIKRELKLPNKLSKKLVEEIGIHIGDGHLGIHKNGNSLKYSYTVSGGYEDYFYFKKHVIPLMYKLY